MNTHRKSRELLDDILTESDAAGFKEALIIQTVSQVRRRGQWRRARRGIMIAALLFLLPVWWLRLPNPVVQEKPQIASTVGVITSTFGQIMSQPLSESKVVHTIPLTIPVFSTVPNPGLMIVTRAETHFYKEISDEELLSLLAGHSVALIRRAPNEAELIWIGGAPSPERPLN